MHSLGSTSETMPSGHTYNAGPESLRRDLANMEAAAEDLRSQVAKTQHETAEVVRSGSAVLAALEAAMIPLMAELALIRQACKEYCTEQGEPFILSKPPVDTAEADGNGSSSSQTVASLEAEIQHLKLDISHYQHKAEHLQADERQRSHEISRICGELSEAYEHLAYEQQCVRHHEVCQQFGIDPSGGGWAGMGPCGIGRRTLEVRAEQKLREHAEQRAGRLARDVSKLAGDTSQQQAAIAQLGARLQRAKKAHVDRDRRLQHIQKQTKMLNTKLKVTSGVGSGSPSPSKSPTSGTEVEAQDDDDESSSAAQMRRSKRKGAAASTGKLPQLSF